jgi:hypothetical protein
LGLLNYDFRGKTIESIDLFILAGQSNALGGTGYADGFPPDEIDNNIRLKYNFAGQEARNRPWDIMAPQSRFNMKPFYGPELTFSRLLKKMVIILLFLNIHGEEQAFILTGKILVRVGFMMRWLGIYIQVLKN